MDDGLDYGESYYRGVRQSEDRPALSFYYRLARSYVGRGRVLDFGCGVGHLIKRFGAGYEARGVEVSKYAAGKAAITAPLARIRSSVEEFGDEKSFDLVVSIHVLEHLARPLDTMLLFSKILKPGGILIFAVPDAGGLGRRFKKERWAGYRDPTHVSLLPASKWLSMTAEAGFTALRTGADGLWDVPYTKILPRWVEKLALYPAIALQVFLGRLILPAGYGESLVVAAKNGG
jgi:SAM-dependent methyltransferase